MPPRISVVIGSDLPQISRQFNTCFRSSTDVHIIGIATDGAGLLHPAKLHHPNVAILSLGVRQTVLSRLVSAFAADSICPVIMSDVLEDAEALELLQRGLVGIL